MQEVDKIIDKIKSSNSITINGITYTVSNCVVAASDNILRLSLHIIDASGTLFKVLVESAETN